MGAALYTAHVRRDVPRAQPARRQPDALRHVLPHLLLVLTARRLRTPLAALTVAAATWWQWSPAIDGIVHAGRDPSSWSATTSR